MKPKDFKTLNAYLGKDAYAYLIIKKNKYLEPSDWRSQLYQKLKDIVSPEKLMFINVNFLSENHINLQSISKTQRSNALMVRRDVLLEIFGSQLEIDYGIAKKIIFVKERSAIYRQEKRKTEQRENIEKKKERAKKNIQTILNKEKVYIPKKEWIIANKEVLKQKAGTCERTVFNKLRKSLKGRVKAQTAFTINGNIYFADMCIKSKKIIVEVDGGYHGTEEQKARDIRRDKDFESIGYTTMRIKNEDVMNKKKLSAFVNRIITSDIIIRDLK
jgi:very-short-patch-repair endonuclease